MKTILKTTLYSFLVSVIGFNLLPDLYAGMELEQQLPIKTETAVSPRKAVRDDMSFELKLKDANLDFNERPVLELGLENQACEDRELDTVIRLTRTDEASRFSRMGAMPVEVWKNQRCIVLKKGQSKELEIPVDYRLKEAGYYTIMLLKGKEYISSVNFSIKSTNKGAVTLL